ncbi:senescence-associated carboxylesterase 101-like, partial [Lotus japonicus]|uniref:senescence-associated carboxylesterase 101-like n=1 Tax=Lotus japonicus TaxID=34305 RepID=UPI00258F2842
LVNYQYFPYHSYNLCWDVISSRHDGVVSNLGIFGLSWKVYKEPDNTDVVIIAFEAVTSDSSDLLQPDLVSSSDLLLFTESNPLFSVNKTAFSLFYGNHHKLEELKSELNISNSSTTKLIVTGHGLGGSIASLFTISLLDNIGSGKKHPLCITFGSPLVGDKKLKQAISRSTCYESSDSILEILLEFGSIHAQNQGFQSSDYGSIVENLKFKPICNDFTTRDEDIVHQDSLFAICISLQLRALGLTPHVQQQKQSIDVKILETKMQILEEKLIMQRRISFDPPKKLSEMKGYLAQLEWYKKVTKDQGIGYYDCYKNMYHETNFDVILIHKNLTVYWEKVVEEAKLKPRREVSAFRNRYLYGGTTYRRIVEPLVIAQYYKEGGTDYAIQRSKHFEVLQEWLKEAWDRRKQDLESTSKKNVKAILTIDSCFWAYVEEALLSCKELKVSKENEEALKKLLEFEEYVNGLLENYAVSPEIFLEKSSFMRWWIEYKGLKGTSYSSPLVSYE